MVARRVHIWHRIAALAPLLMLLVSLPSQAFFRCRFTGQVRSACCCPAKPAVTPHSSAEVSAQDCCDREVLKQQRPIAAAAQAPEMPLGWVGIPVSAVVPVLLAMADPPRAERLHGSHAPPREGPPLVLLKHAFLI
jgi:hypothetical protein